jgi:hypothetical protein
LLFIKYSNIKRKITILIPGNVPPNGEIKFGEKNDAINATIAYGVHAIVKLTKNNNS